MDPVEEEQQCPDINPLVGRRPGIERFKTAEVSLEIVFSDRPLRPDIDPSSSSRRMDRRRDFFGRFQRRAPMRPLHTHSQADQLLISPGLDHSMANHSEFIDK